jgi:hypothetical protein
MVSARLLGAAAIFAIAAMIGCGGGTTQNAASTVTPPAANGVEAFVTLLRSDDPKPAYELLAADVRGKVSYDEFAIEWKASRAERNHQADALEEGLKGDPNLGERAQLSYPDGRTVNLMREGGQWRMESALVSQGHAGRPHDAVRMFAEAMNARDFDGVMRVLTARRRDGIGDQVSAFTDSMLQHINDKIDLVGKDRAELRWDHDGMRYKIVLRKEGDEWRVDDIHIRPGPAEDKDEDDDKDDGDKKDDKKSDAKP